MKILIALVSLLVVAASAAHAGDVRVTIEGTVVSNAIEDPPLGGVAIGEHVSISFEVISTEVTCCNNKACTGMSCRYGIDKATFELGFDGGAMAGLESSPTGGALDEGFLVASPGGPGGGDYLGFDASLSQRPVRVHFLLRYPRWTIPQIESGIRGVLGMYAGDDVELLESRFYLWEDPFYSVVAEFDFARMLIEAVSSTPSRSSTWGEVKDAFRESGNEE